MPPPLNRNFFVLNNGTIQGPFDLDFIQAMVLSDHYLATVQVSPDGKTGWQSLDALSRPTTSNGTVLQPIVRLNDPAPPLPSPRTTVPAAPFKSTKPKNQAGFGCLVIVVVAVFVGLFSSSNNQTTTSVQPQYQPRYSPPPSQSTFIPPTPVYQPPAYTPATPAEQTYSLRGADGQIFRVSNVNYQILAPRKAQLDTWSQTIDREQQDLATMSRQIETDRAGLDRTSQESVDSFNAEVDKYNTENDQVKTAVDSYNSSVNSFNAELDRVGTPTR